VSFIDIVLGLLLLYGLFKGVQNGLLVELASILALVAGLYGAIHFPISLGITWPPIGIGMSVP
jgi:membrane protein required for colicin V production